MTSARLVLQSLARMIRSLIGHLDLQKTTVILTSDHGNIEDLSTKSHTLNAVPTIIWGANKERISAHITSLADITPAIVSSLTQQSATANV